MKNIIKTLVVVMVIVLALAAFTACDLNPQPTTPPACEHTGGTATCENAAICEKCGESYGEKAEHTLVTVDGKEATCTEDGITEGQYCSVCMEVVVSQSVIEAPGHVEVIDEAKAPTCTETGLTEGKHCSVCDKVFVAQTEVPVVAHTYDEGQWDADCNVCGATRTCAHNGNKTVVEGKAPTCTEAGLTNGEKCAVCGDVTKNQETIPALGHTEVVDAAKAATCTETGLTEGKHCSVCNEVLVAQQTVAANGHTEESISAVAPDCENTGLTEGKKCTACGEILVAQTRVPALGHTEVVDAAKAPTCTETGLTEGKHCSVCNKILVEQTLVSALGHKDDNGDFECDVCHVDLCTDHVPAAAVKENEKAPTCTAEGSYDSVIKCSRCGEEISRETVAVSVIPHTEVSIPAVEPDCENTGLTAGKKCSVCGTVTVAQETVNAYGHANTVVPGKAATCEATGLKDGSVCSVCGKTTLAQEVIPALGHNYGEVTYTWSDDNSTCTAKQVCANDASHVIAETTTVSTVTLNVTATKVTFTYTAGIQTKVVEADVTLVDSIATINAPAIAGRVASHDYVKLGFHDAAATYTFTIYYSEVSVWDGVSVSASLTGSGTAEDPYLIQSAADFAYFAGVLNAVEGAAGVNYKVTTFQGQYFKMTKSIDLNGHALIAGAHAGWNDYQGFFGHFDGNNCSIRGISINNDTSSSSALFGCIAKGGSLKNLALYGNVNGKVRLGGLVGYLLGTVDNVTSYVALTQMGTGNNTGTVGGIVANQENSSGAITNCVNYGTITGESYIFGGIVGSGGAAIENCTNWGSVTAGNVSVGGISGSTKDKGTITGCVNYGTIASTSTEYGKVGGIVGSSVKPINNCVNYGEVIANHTAGGIAGDATKEITGCVNFGKISGLSCASYGLNQITPSNVTKTDCVENGSISVSAHVLTHTDANAATCEEDGNVAYDHCSVCNKNYDAEGKEIANVVLKAIGHNYVQGEVANGKITFTCSNCGNSYSENAKYTVTVNHLNIDGTVAAAAETLEFAYDEIATIYAKAIESRVASHDYVKVHVVGDSSVTIYYSEVDVWDGTGTWDGTSNVATSLASLGGSGTQADPYIIDEAQDLVTIANIVNSLPGGGSSALIKGKYFKMTKSIDLNNYPLYIGGFSGWGNRQIFNGHFDGNNCSIRGINNDRALFGCIEGTASNLSLYGKVYNDKKVGNEAGLVGYLRGQVHYITNYVDVSGHTQVGGIVANLESKTASTHLTNYGTIRSITAKGDWSAAGGVIGCVGYGHSDLVNWGDVYSVGSSAGGIGGYGHSSRAGVITNAYNYGTVYCNYNDKGQILGLIASHTYSNCHENGEVKAFPTEE